jgi:hypothetical protein
VLAAAGFLAALVALGAPSSGEGSLLADLSPEERAALESRRAEETLPTEPRELLKTIFELDAALRFDAGLLFVDTDRRWFETTAESSEGGPLLEIRRWPGDSVMAFYALSGARDDERDRPPVPGAVFESPEVTESSSTWRGTLTTEAGSRPVIWSERDGPGDSARLGILLVPGDAGLGAGAVAGLTLELLAAAERHRLREETWENPEQAVDGPIALPLLGLPPGRDDERVDPWQIARGIGFTLGLPPGLRARRLSPEFAGPVPVRGGLLWMRGRFTDAEGTAVIVGDGTRGGYLADASPATPDWTEGKTPPVGASGAKPLAGMEYPTAAELTGAVSARAERWKEPGFDGQWLVFRLEFREGAVEIGLPVLSGRRSPALFEIPLSFRGPGRPPAPPPVDPAKRFGIRFERLTGSDRKRNPWSEGFLNVPGLRLEFPRGWWPVANLRTSDGFPVRIIAENGKPVAILRRLEPGDARLTPKGPEWTPVKRPSRFHSSAVYRKDDGARLYVAREGHGFLIAPENQGSAKHSYWERFVESAFLLRPRS